MADQGAFPFVEKKEEISEVLIRKCRDMKAAIKLSIEISGLPLKEVAFHLDMPDKTLSRMLADNPEDNRHFPPDKIPSLMNITQNEIPLRWLAVSRGYGLFRLKSEIEMENERLKTELAAQEAKLATITEFLKTVKGV